MAVPIEYPAYEVVSLMICLLVIIKIIHIFFTTYSHYKVTNGLLDPSQRSDVSQILNSKLKGAQNIINKYTPALDNRFAKIGFGL
jgi:hypothetical protein